MIDWSHIQGGDMRPIHKICLVLGILWVVVVLPAYISGFNADYPELGDNRKPWFLVSFLPPIALWLVTGTMRHLIAWFRGTNK